VGIMKGAGGIAGLDARKVSGDFFCSWQCHLVFDPYLHAKVMFLYDCDPHMT
jgi:hypothetical protein